MPRTMRSPPQNSPNARTLQETQSEPDISTPPTASELTAFESLNVTTRPGKRFRGNESYVDLDRHQDIMNMLQSWKAEQDIVLKNLVAEVSELKQHYLSIQKSNLDMERAMTFINKNYEEMKTRLEALEKKHKEWEERRSHEVSGGAVQTVAKLEAKIDAMEQQARQCNVEICNLPDKRNENLFTIVQSIGNVINFPVTQNDIVSLHRVPHAQQSDTKPKNVIVKFTSRIVRDNLLSAYRKSKSIKSDQLNIPGASVAVYMNEHLTMKNKTLFRRCRELASKIGFRYVWIRNATILVRERDGLPAFAVRSEDDLSKIVSSDKSTNIERDN